MLVVEEVNDERLRGHWEAERLKPELERGAWVDSAYVLYAYPTYGGILVSRIRPVEGGWAWEGHYTWMAEGGLERDVPARCSLAPTDTLGVPPATPSPRSKAVRSTERNPDTAAVAPR